MLSIQGAIQILPESISIEPGKLRMKEDKTENAVVLTVMSTSGPVQIIFPADSIDKLAEGLIKGKEQSENEPSDIYVPQGGMAEAKALAAESEAITNVAK